MAEKFAFLCNYCGALEPAGSAGDRHLPAACHVCGHGVAFDPLTGVKSYDDDNWTVLAEMPDDKLAKVLKARDLTGNDIGKRKNKAPNDPASAKHVARGVAENPAIEDDTEVSIS